MAKANEEKNNNNAEETTSENNGDSPRDNIVTTKHSVTIKRKKLNYSVTTGTIVLKEESTKEGEDQGKFEGEKPKASIFFIAYTKDGEKEMGKRPITFSFNGGPGSSSVWLHLGVLGPRRVVMGDDDGNPSPPPYQLTDNEYSVLDKTDLVFIDPVSTGYSRIVKGEKASEYHGFKRDIESVGDFIRLYLSRYHRWSSPKFLIGESYGTTRAAGLSGYLQERHGMYLNGLMLISVILNFQTARFGPGNDLPYILFLPTYCAIAWYHKQLKPSFQKDLEGTLQKAREFAGGEYALALLQGDALSDDDRAKIIKKLSEFTGLSEDYIDRSDLRIEIMRFTKELLRDETGETVGRLDGRYKGYDRDSAGEHFEHDPSISAIMGPYTSTLNDYVRSELEFEVDLPYEILNFKVHPWNYSEHQNEYVNVAETLRKAMTINPNLNVFLANGYYDLATPFYATEYTFNHLGIPKGLRENITSAYYEAGHMMYVHMESLKQMKRDLEKFIDNSLS